MYQEGRNWVGRGLVSRRGMQNFILTYIRLGKREPLTHSPGLLREGTLIYACAVPHCGIGVGSTYKM